MEEIDLDKYILSLSGIQQEAKRSQKENGEKRTFSKTLPLKIPLTQDSLVEIAEEINSYPETSMKKSRRDQSTPNHFEEKIINLRRNPQEWIDDEIINLFFTLLSEKYPHFGTLSSFFMVYARSKTWSSTQKTLEAFKEGHLYCVAIPYYTPQHWVLIVLYSDGKVVLLDSLGLVRNLPSEFLNWLTLTFPSKNWNFSIPFLKPHQEDSSNCGVFICHYAEKIAQQQTIEEIDQQTQQLSIKHYRDNLLLQLEKTIKCLNS